MTSNGPTEELRRETEELRRQLQEAQETLRAIQSGEVEALVVNAGENVRVFTLETADRPYRAFLEEMQQGALTLDSDGTILYSNQCFADMIKRSTEGVLGHRLQTFVASASVPYLEALLKDHSALRTQGEIVLNVHDGPELSSYVTINPLRTEGKQTFCVMITDLTEQKRYQDVLADQQLGRLILDQAVDAVVVCDDRGIVIRASQTGSRLCAENPLLQPFQKMFPLSPSSTSMDVGMVSILEVLAGKVVHGAECSLPRDGQQGLELLVSAGPLRNAARSIIGCVVTMSDITRRKHAEITLFEKIQDLEKFEEAVVGRELKMMELEKELMQLRKEMQHIKQQR